MKKTVIIVIAFVCCAATAGAQAAKSVYVELGGPGLASFNFDTRFTNREDGIGGRVGFGGFSIGGTGAIFLPIGMNYLIGKDSKNYFEVGAGVTPVFLSGLLEDEDGPFSTTFGHLTFGYRMQPLRGGFTFRAFVSPVFGKGAFIPYYGGVSFGYKFGSGKH